MPSLDEAKRMIGKLADELGWGNSLEDVERKLWYSCIELGEAGDLWKHRDNEKWLKEEGIKKEEIKDKMMEEIIDAIFYCLHASYCLDKDYDLDEEFIKKYKINKVRERHYIDDHQ